MKKSIPPYKRSLSRTEMIERHHRREYEDTKNELDEFSRRALSGLRYHPEEESLEATLRRIDRRVAGSTGRSFPLRQILSIAAAAALLLAAGYFLFSQPPAHEALFAQQFDYLPSAVNIEGGDRNLPSEPTSYEEVAGYRARAILAYEAGNYQQARELMEKHLAAYSRDTEIRLYLGIVLLGEKNTEPAIRNLETALQELPQPAYERPAKWYLGLAYLQSGQAEQARELFSSLLDGKDRYAKDSRDVLKQL